MEGFTPRQLEMTIKMMNIRRHNDQAFICNINGIETKYREVEHERMFRIMEAKDAAGS